MEKVLVHFDGNQDLIMGYTLPDGERVERTKNGNMYWSKIEPYLGQVAVMHVTGDELFYYEDILLGNIGEDPWGNHYLNYKYLEPEHTEPRKTLEP